MDGAVRIALWGMGEMYREHINLLLAMQTLGQIELVAVADSAQSPVAVLDGMPVIMPGELTSLDFDYLLLLNKNHVDELACDAEKLYRIPRTKIRTYRLLQVPGIDFRSYKRLCESRLSIVSNNCWGGFAYNTLQMECLSPFKNCTFGEHDYLKLLEHLEDYMAIDDVRYVDTRIDAGGNRCFSYELGDIELRLLHEDDPQRALDSWYRRRAKFNWDNILVELYTVNPETERAFEALNRYERRLCFVPYDSSLPHSVQLPVFQNYGLFSNSVNETVREHGKAIAFNLVDLLLGEGDPRRYVLQEAHNG